MSANEGVFYIEISILSKAVVSKAFSGCFTEYRQGLYLRRA